MTRRFVAYHRHVPGDGCWHDHGRLMSAGKETGFRFRTTEEYPEILPADEPHVYVDLTDRPLLEAIDSAFAMIRASLGLPMGPRNINLYQAEKTPRRRGLKRLFDAVARRAGRGARIFTHDFRVRLFRVRS